MNTDVMFSSKSEEWATPQNFYDKLNKEFNFTLDPCSTDENHKCDKYFTEKENGLMQDWQGHTVFCNPPYGREVGLWVKKAFEESQKPDTVVVLLIPARTDTKYFHEYIYKKHEIRFIKGRLKFGNSNNSAPFPSMVVVMKKAVNGKSTGLYDKNNKLICEGDSLSGMGVVVWLEKEARFGIDILGELHEITFAECEQKDLEVIGNIYENKNLLESE